MQATPIGRAALLECRSQILDCRLGRPVTTQRTDMNDFPQAPVIDHAVARVAAEPRRPPRLLLVVLAVHAVCAVTYTWLIPPDRGPDEPHHLAYIEHLHNYRELPHLTSATATRDERDMAIAIHPPLYYLAGWPVYEAVKGLGHVMTERVFRWIALLLGMGTVFLTWRMATTLFPDNPHLPLAAAAFVAFLPEFQLLSAVMNNDGPMMLLSTTLLLLMVQRLERPLSVTAWLLLGALFGVVVMTKASGAASFPVALVLLAYQKRRQSLSWGGVLARAAVYYGTAFALSFWWFLDIKQRWGRFHPIPKSDLNPLLLHDSVSDLLTSGRGWFCVRRFLIGAQQSAWGQVDWFLPMNGQRGVAFYSASVACYLVFTVVASLALAGLGLLAVRWLQKGVECAPAQKAGVALLVTHAGLAAAALTHFALFQHPGGYQGSRYLYPSVAAFGTLFALGLTTLLPERWHKWLAPSLMVGLLVWNVFCALNLIGYLNPLYAPGEGIELRLH